MESLQAVPLTVHEMPVPTALVEARGTSEDPQTRLTQPPVKRGRGRPPKNKDGEPQAPESQPSIPPKRGGEMNRSVKKVKSSEVSTMVSDTHRVNNKTEEQQEATSATCPICMKSVADASETEAGEEAVFCDGECQCWLHRSCASLPKAVFDGLKEEEPFYCPNCSLRTQHKTMSELQAVVTALATQVTELQQLIRCAGNSFASKHPQNSDEDDDNSTWTKVVQRPRPPRRQQGQRSKQPSTSHNNPSHSQKCKSSQEHVKVNPATSQATTNHDKLQNREFEPVPGKRKIWGTMKSCSAIAVSNALHRLTTVSDSISVKRKFKQTSNSRIKWWHVVSGSEEELTKLEKVWELVQNQTAWKLEPCYRYCDSCPSNFLGEDSQTHKEAT